MVTVVVVAVLSASVGMFFVKLMNLHEREREEAYVRERLADICGAYADALSVGSSIITYINRIDNTQGMVVGYRQETGGVSLETGKVTRVAYLASSMNAINNTVDLNVFGIHFGNLDLKMSRVAHGDAALMPLTGDMVSCTITPLGTSAAPIREQVSDGNDADYCMKMLPNAVFGTANTALGWLEVKARYKVKGEDVVKTATAGRMVRLWNRE